MIAANQIDTSGEQEVVIRPAYRVPKGLVTAALLTGLVTSGLSFITRLLADVQRTQVPLYVFLVLWLSASAFLAFSMLWLLFGAQVVSIRGGDLTTRHSIGRVTIGRPRTFAIAHIQDIWIEERTYKVRGNPAVKYAVMIDYLGQGRELLTQLSAQRAESLLAGPLRRFAQHGA